MAYPAGKLSNLDDTVRLTTRKVKLRLPEFDSLCGLRHRQVMKTLILASFFALTSIAIAEPRSCPDLQGTWQGSAPTSGALGKSGDTLLVNISGQKKCAEITLKMSWESFGEVPGDTLKTNTGKVFFTAPGHFDLRYIMTLTESGLRIDQTLTADLNPERYRVGGESHLFKLRDKDTLVFFYQSWGVGDYPNDQDPTAPWTTEPRSEFVGPVVFTRVP